VADRLAGFASPAEPKMESGARENAATAREAMHLAGVEVAVPPSQGYGGGRSFVPPLVGNAKTESLRLPKFRVTSNWKHEACKHG
jgi:hypothetical protein